MSNFIVNLFESIFTPGPTPTLLIATNVAFACLQFILLLLVIATYSIHFFILSALSAALWYSINWFVAELRIAEEEQAEKKRQEETAAGGDDTDTETVIESDAKSGSKEVEIGETRGELKGRRVEGRSSGNRSEISTEDEWEKVSENENEKDK